MVCALWARTEPSCACARPGWPRCKPVYALVVDAGVLGAQQIVDAAVAEASPRVRDFDDAFGQLWDYCKYSLIAIATSFFRLAASNLMPRCSSIFEILLIAFLTSTARNFLMYPPSWPYHSEIGT